MKTFSTFLSEARKTDVTREIQRIVGQRRYQHYGLRVDAYRPRVGDTAPVSNDWSNDNPKALSGTAALAIHGTDLSRAWPIDYSGSYLVLLGSDDVHPGSDRNEVVMTDATVLGVWPMGASFWAEAKDELRTGFRWTDTKGREWEIIERLPFGRFRVRTVDLSRVGEMSAKDIRATLTEAAEDVKVGARFLHNRFIQPDSREPMPFIITRIARGVVYYRSLSADGQPEGTSYKDDLNGFADRRVKRWLD